MHTATAHTPKSNDRPAATLEEQQRVPDLTSPAGMDLRIPLNATDWLMKIASNHGVSARTLAYGWIMGNIEQHMEGLGDEVDIETAIDIAKRYLPQGHQL